MDAQIDTRWFQNLLADKRLSQRQLAKRMDLDPAAVSLMLRGKRKMSAAEVADLAALLGVSADEVLMRAGSAPTTPGRRSEVVQGSVPMATTVRPIVETGQEWTAVATEQARFKPGPTMLKAMDISTPAPELGQPTMFELPVPMSDGSTARLLLPRVLSATDAERIAAMVKALAAAA